MSISPWYQFDTKPSWKFFLLLDSGILVTTGLAPSDFSFRMVNTQNTSAQEIIGAGHCSDLLAADANTPPSIIYNQNRTDVSVPGIYRTYFVITLPTQDQETLSLGEIKIVSR